MYSLAEGAAAVVAAVLDPVEVETT